MRSRGRVLSGHVGDGCRYGDHGTLCFGGMSDYENCKTHCDNATQLAQDSTNNNNNNNNMMPRGPELHDGGPHRGFRPPASTLAASLRSQTAAKLVAICFVWVSLLTPVSSQLQVNSSSSFLNSNSNTSSSSNQQRPPHLQSISNWLRLTSSSQQLHRDAPASSRAAVSPTSGIAVEVSPPPSNMLFQYQPAKQAKQQQQPQAAASTSQTLVATASRNTRLDTDPPLPNDDTDPDQFNLFVSNTCERDFMLVRVRTSRPFYGVIHALNYRRKPRCSLEGDGGFEFQLNISHVLDSRDPAHCGVIKLRKQNEPAGELLSVVLAIRVHRNVELSDDKFIVLNCTNRCRLSDCSTGNGGQLNRQHQEASIQQEAIAVGATQPTKQRQLEKEFDVEVATSQDQTSWWARGAAKRAGGQRTTQGENQAQNQAGATCSVWRFPWLLALVCCLAILLLGAAISNCIVCLSLSARSSPPTRKSAPQTTRSNHLHSDNDDDLDQPDEPDRRKQTTQHKYINYDNSDYYRPVDVAYLPVTERSRPKTGQGQEPRRAGNNGNGSHQQRPRSGSSKAPTKQSRSSNS